MKIKNAAELRDAKQKRKDLAEELAAMNKPEMNPEENRSWETKMGELDGINAAIKEFETFQERSSSLAQFKVGEERQEATPAPAVRLDQNPNGLRLFRNLGEQLLAVREAAFGHGRLDERLERLNNEARSLGNNESTGADGGFAVQTDFAGAMMSSAVSTGDILSRVDTYEVSNAANSVKWTDIDESSVATTVFGGIQVYWRAEGGSVVASRPTLMEVKIDLESLMGVAYATDELMQDTTFMSQLYSRGFTTAIQRETEETIIDGSGVGKPKGILQSGALVVVAKESGQAADTVEYKNFAHMWGRLNATARRNAVWIMHPDVEEQLPFLSLPIGTGGVPVYLPPSGAFGTPLGSTPLATLFGKPIIPSDHCSALGDQGDVILSDLKEYFLAVKGGVQTASSIHVAFLTAENCYRFIFRVNGRTKKNQPVTIKNSSNKRSAFVTLAAR